ncbi:putative S-adenosylmethionine-dependent methyltransferase [Actinomadura rubteroloni]|uniref:Putative S-adenosylmethionine-dependent methyltransferase n=1 Tax=Actinomadura rubteroloni TaxID=1926885 RepID=A0A2P4UJP9_9ACTN|nr:methyltransferase domain-containing protein [Actinomadura rubteroloni]POM25271.1 putative S-adenosylmethionine-dependent methyltransferase [Actinomadura rubteroloni]
MSTVEIQRVAAADDDHWWYRERRALLMREAGRLVAGRALHIGAARDARVLIDQGWETVVIGTSGADVDAARCDGVDARLGDPEALPLEDGEFGFASALDVLPTAVDDRAVVAELARVLRPGGVAFITVPNDVGPRRPGPRVATRADGRWAPLDPANPLPRRYRRASLAELAEGAGFTIDRVRCWNVLLRPALRRHRARLLDGTTPDLSPRTNRTLRTVSRVERRLPLGALRGDSFLVRLRKPM